MKRLARIFLLSLLGMVLATNTNYATTEITERVNQSLNKMFTNDIKIERNASKETIVVKGQNIQIQDNEIKIFDNNNQQEYCIKYNIENNICKFESTTPIELKSDSTEEELVEELEIIMNQLGNYDICYLAVADAIDVDLSLAYSYYAQNYNNELIDTQNKIYDIKTNFADIEKDITSVNNFSIKLQVNCLELMNLSLNDIDKTDVYTVTIIGNEEVKPPVNQEDNEIKEDKVPLDKEEQEKNPIVKEEDKTTVKQEMPRAGINTICGIIICGIIIFAIIIYKQNQKYKDIL